MTTRQRSARSTRTWLVAATVAVLTSVSLIGARAAWADDIPSDPAAHGFIGLCGVDGRPMTGGSIHDRPFVWKAIASQPAPSEARGRSPVATLYAVQPRPGVAAGEWSGDQLTATSAYALTQAPTAQATKVDYGFESVVHDYPPLVHGLYELRMYFGNAFNSGYTDQYAATFIRVTGDRWNVVQGGTLDCSRGRAVSAEIATVAGGKARGVPTASAPYGGPSGTGVPKDAHGVPIPGAASGAGTASTTGAPKPTASSGTTAASGAPGVPGAPAGDASGLPAGLRISDTSAPPIADDGRAVPASAAAHDDGGGSTAWIVVLVAVAVVVLAGGGWFAGRRTRNQAR